MRRAGGKGGAKALPKTRKKVGAAGRGRDGEEAAWSKKSRLIHFDYDNVHWEEEKNEDEYRAEQEHKAKEQEWDALRDSLQVDQEKHAAMLKKYWEDLRGSSEAEEGRKADEEEESVKGRVEELIQLIPMASKDSSLFKLVVELRQILQTEPNTFASAYLRLKFFSDVKVLQRLSQ
eukprot:210722-Hanusia_phi.AAC.1